MVNYKKVYFVKLICFRLWYLFCLFDTVCVLEFFFKQEANRLQYHVLYTCFSSCQLLRSLWSLNILMEIFQFQMMLRDVQYIFIYRYIYMNIYMYIYTHWYIYICLNDLVRTLSYFSSGVNYISCGSNIAVFCAFKNVNQGTKTTY